MKYCARCGQQIDDETRFCNHCGKAVQNGEAPFIQPQSLSSNNRNKKTVWVIMGILSALIIFVFISRINDTPSRDDNPISNLVSSAGTSLTSNTPEDVTLAFMQAAYRKDIKAATSLCCYEDEGETLTGMALLAMTEMSSDYQIRHRPVKCGIESQSSTTAEVNVYDEKQKRFATVGCKKINGKWRVKNL